MTCNHKYGRNESCLVNHMGNPCHCYDGVPLTCIYCGKQEGGVDWTKKDMYEGIGRPDLKPKPNSHQDSQATSESSDSCNNEKLNLSNSIVLKEPESWESNCCCAEIDVVDEKYGICRQCHTRIGYHSPKDCAKYELVYTEEEVQELLQAQKDKMVEELEGLKCNADDVQEVAYDMALSDAINVINNI